LKNAEERDRAAKLSAFKQSLKRQKVLGEGKDVGGLSLGSGVDGLGSGVDGEDRRTTGTKAVIEFSDGDDDEEDPDLHLDPDGLPLDTTGVSGT